MVHYPSLTTVEATQEQQGLVGPFAVPVPLGHAVPAVPVMLYEVPCAPSAWPMASPQQAYEAHDMQFMAAMKQEQPQGSGLLPAAYSQPWTAPALMPAEEAYGAPFLAAMKPDQAQEPCLLPAAYAQPWTGPALLPADEAAGYDSYEAHFTPAASTGQADSCESLPSPLMQPWGTASALSDGLRVDAGDAVEVQGSEKTHQRRRQRRRGQHRRPPPVLKLPMPAGPAGVGARSAGAVPPRGGAQVQQRGAEAQNCAEIMEGLAAGGQAQVVALARLCGSVWRLAREPEGCRAVQEALECAPRAIATTLLAELRCHVREAIESPHANYVIQKAIEVMPGGCCEFIVEELRGLAAAGARHRYGCRVLCRLLEHAGGREQCPLGSGGEGQHGSGGATAALAEELLGDCCADLCRHPFAHHVMQAVLEHGLPAQRSRICAVLRSDLLASAQHRCASHLVEAAVLYCSEPEKLALAAELLSVGPEGAITLATDQFGSFVLRVLLRQPWDCSRAARAQLIQESDKLWADRYGQRVMADLAETPSSQASA